jgi:hypothetical protein
MAIASAACGDRTRQPPTPPSASGTATPAGAASAGPAPSTSPLRADPAWRAALAADDPALVAELGARRGHADLADALAHEAAVRTLALRALPHADRPDLALAALGSALEDGRGDQAAVADAIEAALAASRRDREPVDPSEVVACADALDRTASKGTVGGLDPDRARSLARRVRDRAPPQ